MKFIASAFIIAAAAAASLAQNRSVYTSVKTSNCKTIAASPKEAGSYEGECPGLGGYKVRLLEGDIRQSITLITPTKKKQELNFWQYYSGFSAIGEKIEWRTKKGIPVALITRYNVADADDSTKNTSYLLVSKISKKESCVVDVIMPGAKQNEDARKSADAAAGKPCKATE